VYQLKMFPLNHRYREQAPSHIESSVLWQFAQFAGA
jgi:hypothetical protein